jgi:broad specificity phosphatase PhoE
LRVPNAVASIGERLSRVPGEADVGLVVRHAEREEIPAGTFGSEVALTPRGVVESERLGALLAARAAGRLVSSPVPRCLQTAEAILRGASWPTEVTVDHRLGDPGPFVVEPEVCGPLFLDTPIRELAHRQLSDPGPLPGMRPTAEGVRLLLDLTAGNPGRCGSLNIHVTHDSILAVLVASLFRLPLEQTGWPVYLDGLLLWRSAGRLHFSWRGLGQASHPVGG